MLLVCDSQCVNFKSCGIWSRWFIAGFVLGIYENFSQYFAIISNELISAEIFNRLLNFSVNSLFLITKLIIHHKKISSFCRFSKTIGGLIKIKSFYLHLENFLRGLTIVYRSRMESLGIAFARLIAKRAFSIHHRTDDKHTAVF